MSEPVGVLVMAHGTPGHRDEVEAFYTRIRRGRPPTAEQLDDLQRRYDAIGGLSPLTERTAAQVEGIRAVLDAQAPGRFVVAFGAKHASPLIEDGAATLLEQGVTHVIGLVLTPHSASMGSQEYLDRAAAVLDGKASFTAIAQWYDHPDFVRLMGQRVTAALSTLGDIDAPVVFTAHSLPERVRDLGDDYPEQLEDSARLVAEAAGLSHWRLAWQSAGRTPEPWLGPDIRDLARQLAEGGTPALVVCPIGFVSDHLEILYDIDIELAAVADDVGLKLARTASLNDDPDFIAVLADVVQTATRED
jgi:protoporphyrin/coproporphyrin ferrochelatase